MLAIAIRNIDVYVLTLFFEIFYEMLVHFKGLWSFKIPIKLLKEFMSCDIKTKMVHFGLR